MQGIEMDRVAQLYRKVVQGDGSYNDTLIAKAIPCAIVPISDFATPVSYAYQATHVIWVPYWLILRIEDRLWWGTKPADAEGDLQPYIYTIRGRRQFDLGIPQSSWYAEELQ